MSGAVGDRGAAGQDLASQVSSQHPSQGPGQVGAWGVAPGISQLPREWGAGPGAGGQEPWQAGRAVKGSWCPRGSDRLIAFSPCTRTDN